MRSRHNACFDRNFCSSMRVTRVRIKRTVLGLHDVIADSKKVVLFKYECYAA